MAGNIGQLIASLMLLGSTAQAAAAAAAAAPTTAGTFIDDIVDASDSAHAHCVLGALICLHADLQPYLVTALWVLFLVVLLLVFERSELTRCITTPSEPSSAAFGSDRAKAAAAKARARSHRLRVFCNKVCIQGVKEYLPTSCVQILLGLVFAGMVQISGYHVAHLEEIEPDLFFRFLLPIIIINAGLGVDRAHFFFNLPAILAYAVLGTMVVALVVGYAIYGLAAMNPGPFTLLKNVTKIEALTFGALISAVDPVSVLAVFERMNLNKPLYITLFGESFLNDAVSVILYSMLTKANSTMPANATEWRPTTQEFVGVAMYSVHVVVTSIIIGAACSFMASGLLRVLPHAGNQHLAVVIVLVFGYTSFYLAEIISASGILSAFVCAIVMSAYFGNLTPISYGFLRQSTKSYAEIAEGFTYLVLGVSALNMLFNGSAKALVDVPFIFVTIVLCLVLRFACVYGIGYLLKALHLTELCAGDFFILAYGGLRGANALSLSLMLKTMQHRFADVFLTCTMVTVLLTCFVYGITLKPLIRAIKIQAADKGDDGFLFGQIKLGATDPTKHRPLTRRVYYWSNRINNRYLKRALLKTKVYSNKTNVGSLWKLGTECESLEGLNVTDSNPEIETEIYVVRRMSRGSLGHHDLPSARGSLGDLHSHRSPHETPRTSVAGTAAPADKSGPVRYRRNQSPSPHPAGGLSAAAQVGSRLSWTTAPLLPLAARQRRAAAFQPPPLQLLSAKFFANSGYSDDEAEFPRSEKLPANASRHNDSSHRLAKSNKYADPSCDLSSKASSSQSSSVKSGTKAGDDPKLLRPRGNETEV